MSSFTHNTAPTEFIEAGGIRFAHRRFGKKGALPLVFIPHILGNMDSWDPSVTDGFAEDREVILFDNAGIGSSSGEVPTTFAEMAKSACTFIDALGLAKVDILGFSIGSMIAQIVVLERTDLVRKLVLVGGGPRDGDGIPLTSESQAIFTNKYGHLDDFWIESFFAASPESQAAGRAFLSAGMHAWRIATLQSATRYNQPSSQRYKSGVYLSENALPISRTSKFEFS